MLERTRQEAHDRAYPAQSNGHSEQEIPLGAGQRDISRSSTLLSLADCNLHNLTTSRTTATDPGSTVFETQLLAMVLSLRNSILRRHHHPHDHEKQEYSNSSLKCFWPGIPPIFHCLFDTLGLLYVAGVGGHPPEVEPEEKIRPKKTNSQQQESGRLETRE